MLIKGPFTIYWGDQDNPEHEVTNIEAIDLSYEQASNDYTTIDGRTTTVFGAMSVSAAITFLESDIATLGKVVPQYLIDPGEKTSTGEKSTSPMIDVVSAACDAEEYRRDLDIIACGGENAEVLRLKNCRTSLSTFTLENNQVRTIQVTFTGEPEQGEAVMQIFKNGTLTPYSA